METPTILLLDNGSRRAESTLKLRALASSLSAACAKEIHPVSLQHADKVPADALDGRAADTLSPFLTHMLEQGLRDFLVLPLFFGPSRALSSYLQGQAAALRSRHGAFRLQQAPVLCPLPEGEPRLADILLQQIKSQTEDNPPSRVILVDHGSPIPEVTAVRTTLAELLHAKLPPETELLQAVMERREDPAYDFNGELLEDVLESLAQRSIIGPVILSMLFLSPGRHAGKGGDIEQICAKVRQRHPGLEIRIAPLVGQDPLLIEILRDRLETALMQYQRL
jgi:sirohydrochlorin ferrochelatase